MERIRTFMTDHLIYHTQTLLLSLTGICSIQLIHVSEITELSKNIAQIAVAIVTVWQIIKTNKNKRDGKR